MKTLPRWIVPALCTTIVGIAGCAGSSTKPVARPPGAFDRSAEDGAHLAQLLDDNPIAIAHRRAEQAQVEASEPSPPPVDEVTPKMTAATKALEEGDDATARSLALEVVALDPKGQPYAYVILGDTYLHEKSYTKALEQYRTAIALDENDGWAVHRASEALEKLGRPADARDLLKKYVDSHLDADADTFDALAWIELDLGETKASEGHFKDAELAAKDQDPEAWYGLAMIDAHRLDAVSTEKALRALFDLQPERRVVLSRDPTFFRIRQWQNVGSLFSDKLIAASKAAADAKAKSASASTTP